tara:strand:- start:1286 stop:1732 length:447 start_codon:yes stop_codon:yes gene_type:complete
MSSCKTAWITKASERSKPWGGEISWSSNASNAVKTLTLEKGKRNSFKYNANKDEMLICGAGKVKVYFGDEELITKEHGDLATDILEPGSALIVQSSCPYRLEAIEDSIILEVSSRIDAGPVRLHDDYGRATITPSDFMSRIILKWFPT